MAIPSYRSASSLETEAALPAVTGMTSGHEDNRSLEQDLKVKSSDRSASENSVTNADTPLGGPGEGGGGGGGEAGGGGQVKDPEDARRRLGTEAIEKLASGLDLAANTIEEFSQNVRILADFFGLRKIVKYFFSGNR